MLGAIRRRCSKRVGIALTLALLVTCPAQAQSPNSGRTQQEQRKLELEVEKLTDETSPSAEVRAWLSASSILIALLAASFTVYQYFRDQRLSSQIRIEQQLAAHVGTLSDYSEDGKLSTARVAWALDSLRALTMISPAGGTLENRVTDVLTTGVLADADFERREHVRLDRFCLDRWPGYARWLAEHPNDRSFVLYRYRQAMRVLAERHETYFETMRLGDKGYVVDKYIPEADYMHFLSLADGYGRHIADLPDTDRAEAVDAFGDAMGNRALAHDQFADGDT